MAPSGLVPQAKLIWQGHLVWDLSVAFQGAGGNYQEEVITVEAFKTQVDIALCNSV